MKISKIDAQTYSVIVSDKALGLSAHFSRLREGNMPTPSSPLWRGRTEQAWTELEEILSRYEGDFPRLIEYERTRTSKIGPQGGYPPLSQRMNDLGKYFGNMKDISLNSTDYNRIVLLTRAQLFGNGHSKRALSVDQVIRRDIQEDKVNSNSGLPDFGKRSDRKIQERALKDAKNGKWKQYPYVLGSRSSRGKARFIFMSPMSTNLNGKRFFIPLMEEIRRRNVLSFSAWEGFNEVELSIKQQEDTYKNSVRASQTYVSMDYSAMDTTVGLSQMQFVYDVCAPIFQPKFREEFKESLFHGVTAGVMISEDKIAISPNHGIFSGTEWTNFAECVISAGVHIRIAEVVSPNAINSNPNEIKDPVMIIDQLLGDDGAFSFNQAIESSYLGKVIAEVSEEFGLTANPDKQRIDGNTFTYLQRFFDTDIPIKGTNVMAGSYPGVLALNTAMNPERFHDPRKWTNRMEVLRWIMILENCHHNPYFDDLIKLFVKGDKYRLGLDIPNYFESLIHEDFKIAKQIKGFVPTYTTANRARGIGDFDTVKVLKSMR